MRCDIRMCLRGFALLYFGYMQKLEILFSSGNNIARLQGVPYEHVLN